MPVIDVPCECQSCQRSEYVTKKRQETTPYVRDDGQAQERTVGMARSAADYYHTLHVILQHHSPTIIKRWRRKTPAQRRRALLIAYPSICQQDKFWMLRRLSMSVRKSVPKPGLLMRAMPFINIETLCEDANNLLGLLHYRTEHSLAEFAVSVAYHLQEAWWVNGLPHHYADCCVSTRDADYGKLVPFDLDAIHRGDAMGYPKARLVFNAQAELGLFLLKMVANIMHDRLPEANWQSSDHCKMPNEIEASVIAIKLFQQQIAMDYELSPEQCPVSVDAGANDALEAHLQQVLVNRSQSAWTSLCAKQRAELFMGPPEFPITEFIRLAKARFADVQDDLWLLQTDPNYFRHRLEVFESKEQFFDFDKTPELATEPTTILIWIRKIVMDPMTATAEWHDLLLDLEHVRQERALTLREDVSGLRLLTSYDEALSCLYLRVGTMLRRRSDILDLVLKCAWTYKQFYDKLWQKHPNLEAVYKKDKVFTLLLIISLDADLNNANIMSILKHLEEAVLLDTKAEYCQVDDLIAAILSDISILEYIRKACQLQRPRHSLTKLYLLTKSNRSEWRRLQYKALDPYSIVEDKAMTLTGGRANFYDAAMVMQVESQKLISAFQKFNTMRMPKGKRNKEWLKTADHARDALTQIWEEAFKLVDRVHDKIGLATEHRQIYHDTTLKQYNTPEHLAALAEERRSILDTVERTEPKSENIAPLPTATADCALAFPHWYSTPTTTIEPQLAQPKIKTRGAADVSSNGREGDVAELDTINQPLSTPVLFHIDLSSQALIDFMFGTTSRENVKGSTDWNTFATFMTALGFGVEPCGGSCVLFKGTVRLVGKDRSIVEQERSIMIHRPYPKPEMSFHLLRRVGSRLTRRFGWTSSHFSTLQGSETRADGNARGNESNDASKGD